MIVHYINVDLIIIIIVIILFILFLLIQEFLLNKSLVKFNFVEQVIRGHSVKRTMKQGNSRSSANVSQNNSRHGKKRLINFVI